MKRNTLKVAAGTGLTFALAISLAVAPAHAETMDPLAFSQTEATQTTVDDDLIARLKASAPKNLAPNEVAFVSEAGTKIVAYPEDGNVSLNPVVIAACNAGMGDVVVQDFQAAGLGKVTLNCGNDAAGYVHIRRNHQNDWQTIVDSVGGGYWDDLMAYATNVSLLDPSPTYPRDVGNNKWCYTTPVVIVSRNGETTYRPSVYVSVNNKIVITSFPTRTPNC